MAKSKKNEATFEEIVATAEERIATLEKGDLGLEEALRQYEEGMTGLRAALAIVNRVETRIRQLAEDDAGAPRLGDFGEIAPADAAEEDGEE